MLTDSATTAPTNSRGRARIIVSSRSWLGRVTTFIVTGQRLCHTHEISGRDFLNKFNRIRKLQTGASVRMSTVLERHANDLRLLGANARFWQHYRRREYSTCL